MLRAEEVNAAPDVGQWRALLEPLCLMRMGGTDEKMTMATVKCWFPDRTEICHYVMPIPKNRLLWWEGQFQLNLMPEELTPQHRPGSVFIVPQLGRLFFIGPHPKKGYIQVLADWVVDLRDHFCDAQLFQVGPPLEDPETGETGTPRYDRLEPL